MLADFDSKLWSPTFPHVFGRYPQCRKLVAHLYVEANSE